MRKEISYFSKLLVVFLAAFCSYSFPVQNDSLWSIKGRVLSARTGEPPIECIIYLKDTPFGTVTDSTGGFAFHGLHSKDYTLTVSGFGYNKLDTLIKKSEISDNYILYIYCNCTKYNKENALKDIEDESPKLLLVGSIAPVIYPEDEEFYDKYGVEYYDFGCTPPAYECIREYNMVIFEYLDSFYGSAWRKDVRNDVMFLKK